MISGFSRKSLILGVLMASMGSMSSAADNRQDADNYLKKAEKGLYATFHTNMGSFVVALFPKDAPMTVENFTGLAQGKKEYTDVKTGKKTMGAFYNGIIFHRVIPNFMIQGGDPLGQGRGGPGYQFKDEFESSRVFDKPGILAMANSGPNTNGSQFFITVAPTPWLNKKHTIFGEVVFGYNIVEAISQVKTTAGNNKPIEPVIMKEVIIKKI